jgi:hypothetical protein
MNAVNIALTILNDEIIDLYVLDHSPECYRYYLILKESKVFKQVYFLKTRETYSLKKKNKVSNLLSYRKKAFNALNYKRLENNIPNKESCYESIFVAYPDLPTQIIYYYFKKQNFEVKFNLFEDGIYTYNALNKKDSWLRVRFSRMVFGSYVLEDCKSVYAYKPNFVNIKNKGIERLKIPEMKKSKDHGFEIINKLMGFDESHIEYLSNKCIFFDQPFGFDEIMKQQSKLLKIICEIMGPENVGVKIHPRTQENLYQDTCNVINIKIPFEILELNFDINNIILISVLSTACLNPKIVFNEEPYVILLYKLIELQGTDNAFLDIVLKVKNSYNNKNRFFIPETVEELMIILTRLKGI